jgi:hypothetical protein
MIKSPFAKIITIKVLGLAAACGTAGGVALAANAGAFSSAHATMRPHSPAAVAVTGNAAPATSHTGASTAGQQGGTVADGTVSTVTTTRAAGLCWEVASHVTDLTGQAVPAGQTLSPAAVQQALASTQVGQVLENPAFASLTSAAGAVSYVPDYCAILLSLPQFPEPGLVRDLPARVLTSLPAGLVAKLHGPLLAELPVWYLSKQPAHVLTGLPVPVIAELPARVITELPAGTIAELPAGTIAGLPSGTIAELPAGTIAELPAPVIAELPTWVIGKLPAGTIARLPIATIAKLPIAVVSELPVPVLSQLPVPVLSQLPTGVLAQLPPSVQSGLPSSVLSKLKLG